MNTPRGESADLVVYDEAMTEHMCTTCEPDPALKPIVDAARNNGYMATLAYHANDMVFIRFTGLQDAIDFFKVTAERAAEQNHTPVLNLSGTFGSFRQASVSWRTRYNQNVHEAWGIE